MRKTVISFIFVLMTINLWAFKVDKLYYRINSDSSTVSVATWPEFQDREYSGVIVIPPKIIYNEKEYIVTEIDRYAFYECKSVPSITIPKTVTKIGEAAFALCSGLESISFQGTITEIGDYLFGNCQALKNFGV